MFKMPELCSECPNNDRIAKLWAKFLNNYPNAWILILVLENWHKARLMTKMFQLWHKFWNYDKNVFLISTASKLWLHLVLKILMKCFNVMFTSIYLKHLRISSQVAALYLSIITPESKWKHASRSFTLDLETIISGKTLCREYYLTIWL